MKDFDVFFWNFGGDSVVQVSFFCMELDWTKNIQNSITKDGDGYVRCPKKEFEKMKKDDVIIITCNVCGAMSHAIKTENSNSKDIMSKMNL